MAEKGGRGRKQRERGKEREKKDGKGRAIQLSHFCRTHDHDRPTDQPTDHATLSVIIGCIYLLSTAMWPNNNNNNVHISVVP